MSHDFADIDVLFIAGFGPITRSTSQSRDFYCVGFAAKADAG